MPDVSFIYPFA